ncbi:uncharacterized protein LOC127739176 [Mytilus californianus]|uniref:uncharacterized protein LOC127739176 n=1 Tax=Mytilus californianus TaxID=6549 RepID=UPI002245F849|nr:uncharacterized protein LOC127739176 [Mytilus californianus]
MSATSGTVNDSDFEEVAKMQSLLERPELQQLFRQIGKISAAEALKEHDIIKKDLRNLIEQKNFEILELENAKATLEIRLNAVAENTEEKKKMQGEIIRLENDIKKKKKDLVSLNKKTADRENTVE